MSQQRWPIDAVTPCNMSELFPETLLRKTKMQEELKNDREMSEKDPFQALRAHASHARCLCVTTGTSKSDHLRRHGLITVKGDSWISQR